MRDGQTYCSCGRPWPCVVWMDEELTDLMQQTCALIEKAAENYG